MKRSGEVGTGREEMQPMLSWEKKVLERKKYVKNFRVMYLKMLVSLPSGKRESR